MPPPGMRLYLLPISTRRSLLYCEPLAQAAPPTSRALVLLDKAVDKANTTWSSWESADAIFDWKRRLTRLGNKAFRRIPFEEWGLKTIPRQHTPAAADAVNSREPSWEVRYPACFQGLAGEGVMAELRRLATERQAFHRQRMWWCGLGAPCTAPFMLVPVVPNIPFFYLAFRCYSHWTALRGAQHLESALSSNLLRTQPSTKLDTLYALSLQHPSHPPSSTTQTPTAAQSRAEAATVQKRLDANTPSHRSPAPTNPSDPAKPGSPKTSSGTQPPLTSGASTLAASPPSELMLLAPWSGKALASDLGLPALQLEVERAVEQVGAALDKASAAREKVAEAVGAAVAAGGGKVVAEARGEGRKAAASVKVGQR